jgi:carbamoyltransferase
MAIVPAHFVRWQDRPQDRHLTFSAFYDWKKKEIADAGCTISYIGDEEELSKKTAQAITDGKIVGWFHGRMEWGPRALGNRSILGDPRNAGIKDVLNAKIKRRESFGPFALSILREAAAECLRLTTMSRS